MSSVSDILLSIANKILSGGKRTTAQSTRDVLNDIANSYSNFKSGGASFEAEVGYKGTLRPTQPNSFATKDMIVSASYAGATPTNTVVGGVPSGFDPTGLTSLQLWEKALVQYLNPVFTSFSISGLVSTVEWGTTLTGAKSFNWSINSGSGTVPTIDVLDNTAGTVLLAGTPNSGTQAVTINTILLNTNGASQSWALRGNNTGNGTTFNSGNFIVTSRPVVFLGQTTSTPTTSAQVRALPQSTFYVSVGVVQLNTGTSIKFGIAVPPGSTVVSAIDIDASNANVTYSFVGNINVLDAAGAVRIYPYYEANIASPYSFSHRHNISIS